LEVDDTCANGVDGVSDVEGKVARVATSKLGNERVSIDRFIAEGGETIVLFAPAANRDVSFYSGFAKFC
jgi:hypothetical protein